MAKSKGRRPSVNPKRYVSPRSTKALKSKGGFIRQWWTAYTETKALRNVKRYKGMPKSRIGRIIWQLKPSNFAAFWFNRDGGILALKITGVGIFIIFIFTVGIFAFFRKDLPNITVSGNKLGGSTSYYDRTGKTLLFQDYDSVKRVTVPSSEISPYIKDATVVVEDKDFYNHRGFDLRGIIRAALNDIFHKGGTQGGSTITQQLVKLNEDWTQQRSIGRKIKEIILAVELERSYTKDEILTGYLNAAPYGSIDYGVQTASADYFQKSAKDLTIAEAAMLAAIPKSPAVYSKYSPDFDQQLLIGRQHYVIDRMLDAKKITKAQADEAKKVDIVSEIHPQSNKYAGIKYPYFVQAAKDELTTKFVPTAGSKSAGNWKVITTLDVNLQDKAEETVQKNIPNITRNGADESAMVVEDVKTGQMRALVGGTDFNNPDHGYLNYAHSVKVSPGSSFKPYDYTTFIENNNAGAGSVLYDATGPVPGYPCTDKSRSPNGNCLHDYDFTTPGPLTLRYALGGSRNIPAVKAMLSAVPNDNSPGKINSVNKVISTANALMASTTGYKCYKSGTDVNNAKQSDETQCYGASAIGDGAYLHLDDHVNGVASLARLGNAIPYTYILQINDASNKAIYKWQQPKGTQVVRPESAYIVSNMASDPNASYLSGSQKWQHYKGWVTSVKTGTTNDNYDGLMMSWNTQFAVGSWVGYHTRNKTLSTAMENLTLPLTRTMMQYALDSLNMTPVNLAEPAGIQHLPAYVIRNHVGFGSIEPSPSTDLFPSWYKPKGASSSTPTINDKVSNKLATKCTPPLAQQKLTGSGSTDQFSVDIFFGPTAASDTSSGLSDDVHICSDNPPGSPTITANTDTCTVGADCSFVATVQQGTHLFNDPAYPQYPGTLNFFIDGQNVKSVALPDNACSGTVCTITVLYTPTADQAGKTITATASAVDSVLYESARSGGTSVQITAAAPSGNSGGGNGGNDSGNSTN